MDLQKTQTPLASNVNSSTKPDGQSNQKQTTPSSDRSNQSNQSNQSRDKSQGQTNQNGSVSDGRQGQNQVTPPSGGHQMPTRDKVSPEHSNQPIR